MDIPESDWLKVGFFWMAVGFIAAMPPLSRSLLGGLARWLFNLTVAVHLVEAFYSISVTRRAGLNERSWFLKTLFLGYFALRKLSSAPMADAHAD